MRGDARITGAEIAADGYAIGLMARAEFDLQAPERFLRRSAKSRWVDIASTHPGTARRVAIVNEAISHLPATASESRPVQLASIDAAQPAVALSLNLGSVAPTRSPVSSVTDLARIALAAPFANPRPWSFQA